MSTASSDQIVGHNPEAAKKLAAEAQQAEKGADRWKAIELYRKAFESDSTNAEIAFRLAYNLDLVGEEDEALHLYEQACSTPPVPVNALLNLAIMYEDNGDYTKAERCLKLILDNNPNHTRARLYMKDVSASSHMYYQEKSPKFRDKYTNLLETPVTDFELSIRARNCLKKMNIRTLGDLLRISEAELLAYKNFGETTLSEIKAMLAQKGLRIGQALQQAQTAAREEVYNQLRASQGDEAAGILNKSVDDLALSVRARKALGLLNIATIGDLVSHTEAELLGIKNFGTTSLDEIKQKLTEHGLALRNLEEA